MATCHPWLWLACPPARSVLSDGCGQAGHTHSQWLEQSLCPRGGRSCPRSPMTPCSSHCTAVHTGAASAPANKQCWDKHRASWQISRLAGFILLLNTNLFVHKARKNWKNEKQLLHGSLVLQKCSQGYFLLCYVEGWNHIYKAERKAFVWKMLCIPRSFLMCFVDVMRSTEPSESFACPSKKVWKAGSWHEVTARFIKWTWSISLWTSNVLFLI